MKRWARLLLFGCGVLVVLAAAATIWIYRQLDQDTIELDQAVGELVFMSDRDGDWDLYLLEETGELRNLTAEAGGHEYYPGFTFDGEQVSLFSTSSGTLSAARVNADGSNFRTQTVIEAIVSVLAEGKFDWDPAWDPGGDRLAWNKVKAAGLLPQVDLFLADADGDNERPITDNRANVGMHAWSPDGIRLVYTSDEPGKYNTYTVNVDDGTVTRLTDHDVSDYQPFYSLDGNRILVIFSFQDSMLDGELEMHVMNADGSDLRPLGEGEVFAGDLTYAPNGGQVAYVSNETGWWHIYLMDADGSNVRQLTEGDSNNLYPAWRPIPAEQGAGEDK